MIKKEILDSMKNWIVGWVCGCMVQAVMAQEVPEKYLKEIDKISNQYNHDMKYFLRTLDAHTTSFDPAQKAQFCGIVIRYTDDFYQVTDKYRASLPLSYAQMTKQDVVQKVMQSKEMMLLSRYQIQCDFKTN